MKVFETELENSKGTGAALISLKMMSDKIWVEASRRWCFARRAKEFDREMRQRAAGSSILVCSIPRAPLRFTRGFMLPPPPRAYLMVLSSHELQHS